MAEYIPLGVGAAVGVGMGLVDRAKIGHEQLLYRGGGLAAALLAQHQGWGAGTIAPAAVTSFAAHFAARAVGDFLSPGSSFGDVSAGVGAGGAAPAGDCGCGGSH
jgi:hypothetical protein